MPDKKPNHLKLELGVSVAVIAVLVVVVAALFLGQTQTQQPGKVASVPTEIKTTQEASVLEQDTSKILQEVGDALTNIDASLPEV